MPTMTWQSETDTQTFAERLAAIVEAGDIICLSGDLGVGKTTFTRYFAGALGIHKRIKSPTFTIVREYTDGRLPLYHMDAYRLEQTGTEGIGIDEYLEGDGVSMIEWPQFIEDYLPKDYLWLDIKRTGDTSRQIEISAVGSRSQALAHQLNGESE
ncbi:tRNA (adenosine(37)-N6)-threonylcarbamoyltransferase complex ATPase subunit type 1 TsaE [Aerococcus vaginalis]